MVRKIELFVTLYVFGICVCNLNDSILGIHSGGYSIDVLNLILFSTLRTSVRGVPVEATTLTIKTPNSVK